MGEPDAEDCVGDALGGLIDRIKRGAPPPIEGGGPAVPGYISQTVRNWCLGLLRHWRHVRAYENEARGTDEQPDDERRVRAREALLVVQQLAEALPDSRRLILEMLTEEKGETEIREALGLPEEDEASFSAELRAIRGLLKIALAAEPHERPRVFEMVAEGKGAKQIRRELGWPEEKGSGRAIDTLMAGLASLYAWLKSHKWTVVVTATVVATIITLFLKPEPRCTATVMGTIAEGNYMVRYSGDCAIGVTDVDHPDLQSAPSPIPANMILHGVADVGMVLRPAAGGVAMYVRINGDSYAVTTNRYHDNLLYCEGNDGAAACRDVKPGHHARYGARPQQWKHDPEALEALLIGAAEQPLTEMPEEWERDFLKNKGRDDKDYLDFVTSLLWTFSVSMKSNAVSYAALTHPVRGTKLSPRISQETEGFRLFSHPSRLPPVPPVSSAKVPELGDILQSCRSGSGCEIVVDPSPPEGKREWTTVGTWSDKAGNAAPVRIAK